MHDHVGIPAVPDRQKEPLVTRPQLTDIPGIGPAAVADLAAARITTVSGLARAPLARIESVKGFGPTRAAAVKTFKLLCCYNYFLFLRQKGSKLPNF